MTEKLTSVDGEAYEEVSVEGRLDERNAGLNITNGNSHFRIE